MNNVNIGAPIPAILYSTIGRGATFFVAASDATALEIAQADYICDGTADDVQIQAAIDALPAGGGSIRLSSGTFTIAADATINLTGKTQIELKGSLSTTIVFASNPGAARYLVDVNIASGWAEISGIRFYGGSYANAGGIYITTINPCHIHDCYIHHFGKNGVSNAQETHVTNCRITSNDGWGVRIHDRSVVSHNHIAAGGVDQLGGGTGGVYIANAENVVSNNRISGGNQGIRLAGEGTITGNTIQPNVGSRGIYADIGAGGTISGNRIDAHIFGDPSFGIDVYTNSYLLTITGNTIDHCTTGIRLNTGSMNCVVTGNSVKNATTEFSDVAQSDTNTIANNSFAVSGEVRTASGALAAGTVGNAVIAWQNPEAQALLASSKVRVTTGGVATCVGAMGLASVVGGGVLEDCEDVWNEVHASTCTLTNTTGILTESGVALDTGANVLNITGAGTFTFALPSGYTATVANGTATVTPTGAVSDTLVIDSGTTTGTITVTVTSVVVCTAVSDTVDTSYVQRGTYILKFTIPATVDQNDIVAAEARASINISTATHIQMKVMATTTTVAGDYQLLLDEDAKCASPSYSLNLPVLTANVMQTVVLNINAGAAAGATADAIISIGLKYTKATSVANVLYIDDIRAITVGATMFQALPIATADSYDSNNATDAGTGKGKPIYMDAKNGTNDTLVMVSGTAASTGIVGKYYIQGIGV